MDVAVVTMVRNEGKMLPRWLAHYGREVGRENLVLLDDRSEDGSTRDIDATVIRLPRRASTYGVTFDTFRAGVVNKLSRTLLDMYDVVVFADADELIVADPRRYSGLVDYLERNPHPVIAPLGLTVMQVPGDPDGLSATRPVLEQRRHAIVSPLMCKPAIKRVPARWSNGTHGISEPYAIHRDLYLIHLHYADVGEARSIQERWQREFHEHGTNMAGHAKKSPDEIAAWLAERVESGLSGDPMGNPTTLDPVALDLDGVVRPNRAGTGFVSRPTGSSEHMPVYRLPDYISGV